MTIDKWIIDFSPRALWCDLWTSKMTTHHCKNLTWNSCFSLSWLHIPTLIIKNVCLSVCLSWPITLRPLDRFWRLYILCTYAWFFPNKSFQICRVLNYLFYDYPTIIIRLYLATVDLSEAYHNIAWKMVSKTTNHTFQSILV